MPQISSQLTLFLALKESIIALSIECKHDTIYSYYRVCRGLLKEHKVSVWPFEQPKRRLHIPELLQTCQAHLSFFMYGVYRIMYGSYHYTPFYKSLGIFFRNYWKRNANITSGLYGLCFTGVFCISVVWLRDSTWHSVQHWFHFHSTMLMTAKCSVQSRLASSAIFVFYFIKYKQSSPANKHGG